MNYLQKRAEETGTGLFHEIGPDKAAEYLRYTSRSIEKREAEAMRLLAPGRSYADALTFVDILNNEMCLHLDDVESHVIALHLFKLKDPIRFRNDVHLNDEQFDRVGWHTSRVSIQADDIFKEIKDINNTVAEMRRTYVIGTLLHDLGEIVCEFYSVAEENDKKVMNKLDKADQIELEDRLASFVNKLALHCVFAGKNHLYFNAVNDMRRLVGVVDGADGITISPQIAADKLNDFIDNYDFDAKFPTLDATQRREINTRLNHPWHGLNRYYQHPERFKGTGGPAIKIGQIIDGNNSFINWVKDNIEGGDIRAVPYSLSTFSRQIFAAYNRTEPPLKHMFTQAQDVMAQRQLAIIQKKKAYASLISHLSVGPFVIDRNLKQDDPEPLLADGTLNPARVHALKKATQRSVEEAHNYSGHYFRADGDRLPLKSDIITAEQMLLLYSAGWLCDDYMPDETPLMMKREVPEELVPYVVLLEDFYTGGLEKAEKTATTKNDPAFEDAYHDIVDNAEQITAFFQEALYYQHKNFQLTEDYIRKARLAQKRQMALRPQQ